MKSLRSIITRYIVAISSVMAIVAFGILFAVVYFIYSDHDTSAFDVLVPIACIFVAEVLQIL